MNYSENAGKKKSAGKKAKNRKRKNSIGIVIIRVLMIVVIVGAFAVIGGSVGAYMGIVENTELLNTDDVVPESYTSIVYDSAGNEIDRLHGDENREYVQLDDIPQNLQNAVVAIEDERFFDHNGIDFRGIMRAVVANIKSGRFSQGASTLTQQLIKNEGASNEKTITRKVREQYLAVTFERDLEKQLGSKKQAKKYILELYLNSIALGHGLNGVKTASEFYFGKDVSELTLAEAACIAGITNNPSGYSPISYPEYNKDRQTMVLQKMLENGYITQQEHDEALAEDIYANIVGQVRTLDEQTAQHSYFVDALIVQLAEDLQTQKNMNSQQAYNMIYSGGLTINATVDTGMQNIMEESYKNDSLFPPRGNTLDASYTISIMDNATQEQQHIERKETVYTQEDAEAFAQGVRDELLNESNTMVADRLTVTESLQSAMVIMDYHNGEIKALIGGRGEKKGDLVFNRATDALRQPGSSFKPVASYAPAIDLGLLSPGSVLMDEPLEVNGKKFQNWNKAYKGAVTVREAIRDSMNIVAVKTLMMVGYDRSFEYLKNFGITSLVDNEEINGGMYSDKGPATALGGLTRGVSVLELTGAYSALANKGMFNKPVLYSYVLDHSGQVLLDNRTNEPTQVVKESTAFMLTDMMEDVITGGGSATGRLANFRNKKMTIAGKTGTTSDDKDLTFVGYTPYYCAGIWLGYDNPRPMSYDKSYHLLLWRDIMEKIHADLPNKDFEAPGTVTKKVLCMASGLSPISGVCNRDYFGNGATNMDYVATDSIHGTGTCNLHKMYKIDVSTGMLANQYCGSVKSVSLAVDSNGNIVNASGDVTFRPGQYCTVHNANNRGERILSGDDNDDGQSSDNPSDTNENPEGNAGDDNETGENSGTGSNSNTQAPVTPEPEPEPVVQPGMPPADWEFNNNDNSTNTPNTPVEPPQETPPPQVTPPPAVTPPDTSAPAVSQPENSGGEADLFIPE